MAPYRLGIVAHEIKQGATDMLATRRFVHTQVIDIQGLAVFYVDNGSWEIFYFWSNMPRMRRR